MDVDDNNYDISYGFYNCLTVQYIHFNNTAHVTGMEGLFYGATNLISVEGLETDNVENMAYMFSENSAHQQTYNFDGSRLTNISGIVMDAPNVVVKVHRLTYKNGNAHTDEFIECSTSLTPTNVRCFTLQTHSTEVSIDLYSTSDYCLKNGETLEYIDLEFSISDLKSVFQKCAHVLEVEFYPVGLTQANDTSNMLYDAISFNGPVKLDTSQVTNMDRMFQGAQAFNQELNFNTSNVESMGGMFAG